MVDHISFMFIEIPYDGHGCVNGESHSTVLKKKMVLQILCFSFYIYALFCIFVAFIS